MGWDEEKFSVVVIQSENLCNANKLKGRHRIFAARTRAKKRGVESRSVSYLSIYVIHIKRSHSRIVQP